MINKQVNTASPLDNSSILPWYSIKDIAWSPVLIVAPHPDDETLGCGGAIALLRSLNCDVRVLVISDGTLSHPRSLKYPAPALRALRESETLSALSVLGVEANAVTFYRMQDGSISVQYKSAVDSCRTYLTEISPQIIFLPWRYDPHPDHRATWKLIHTALVELHRSPRLIEYPIWDWDQKQRQNLPESLKVTAWRLHTSTVVELKQQAIA
ncbi:PIG-L family deacetylase, partial [Komarekiella sp. 'clone 1']